jgi:hypothetical protein
MRKERKYRGKVTKRENSKNASSTKRVKFCPIRNSNKAFPESHGSIAEKIKQVNNLIMGLCFKSMRDHYDVCNKN